jgi:hypothetical protein
MVFREKDKNYNNEGKSFYQKTQRRLQDCSQERQAVCDQQKESTL